MAVSLSPLDGSKNLAARSPRDDSTAKLGYAIRSLCRTTSARSSAGSMYDDELAEVTVPQIWAGVDIGKEHHHWCDLQSLSA